MSEAKEHPEEGKVPDEETTAKTDDAREQERQAELQEKLHDMGVMPRPEEMREITPRRLTSTLVVGMVLLTFIIAGIYWWHERGGTTGKEQAESPSSATALPVTNPPAPGPGPVAGLPGNGASQGAIPVTPPSSASNNETPDAGSNTAASVPPVPPRWGLPPAWRHSSTAWTPAYGWQPPPPGWSAPPPPAPTYPGWGPYGYYPPPPRW